MLCVTGCQQGNYAISITPDGSPVENVASQSNQVVGFVLYNLGSSANPVSLSCSASGNVTCTRVENELGNPITSYTLDVGESIELQIRYSTGAAGSGTITLNGLGASGSDDSGYWDVTVTAPGAPTVALMNANGTVVDRGRCFTSGAGAGAGISCGDLFVQHGMPAYRTKGRDRSLGLLYNSATAKGVALVDADVLVPSGQATPNYIRAVLTIGGQTDSADYLPPVRGTHMQLALGYRISNLATGSYPYTLKVRNVYSSGVYETVTNGRTIVVNRSASAYGRGWGLLGVEALQFTASADTILWLDGDGSAGLYTKVTTNTWVAPKADFRDTLTYNTTSHQYTRALQHRVKVVFDSAGRHLYTVNRFRDTTTFGWTTVGGQMRLTTITLPPLARQYHLYYNSSSALLDSILDPGNRRLKVLHAGIQDTSIVDPDGQATSFAYDATHLLMVSRAIVNPAGPGGKTTVRFGYAHGLRVTRVVIPAGSAGTDSSVTAVTPWDEQGLGVNVLPYTNYLAPLDANGQATLIDGPIAGTGDQLEVVVDSFGQPRRLLMRNPTRLTVIDHANSGFPALVTKMTKPSGEIFTLTYDSRGNLTSQRDSTSGLPTGIHTWVYASANEPDAPSASTDSIGGVGRTISFTYDSLGELQHSYEVNGAHTEYSFFPSGQKRGLVQWVRMYGVAFLDTAFATRSSDSLQTTFAYDTNGNVLTTTQPTGVVNTTLADSLGRVVATWDPYGMKVRYVYDVLNRVTDVWQYSKPQANSYYAGGNPLSGCRTILFYCGNDSTTTALPMPAGFPDSLRTRTFYGSVGVDSILDPRNVVHGTRYNGSAQGWITTDEARRGDTTFIGNTGLVDQTKTRDSQTVRYHYDGMGRKTSMVYPTRTWAARKHAVADTVPGDSVVYAYDSLDRVISIRGTRVGPDTIVMSYFANGALKTRIGGGQSGQRDTLSYTYDAVGALIKVGHASLPGGPVLLRDTTRYFYHPSTGFLDSITVQVVKPDTGELTGRWLFTFQHDTLGRETSITYPTGLVVHKGYDALGGLRQLYTTSATCPYYGYGTGRGLCFSLSQTKVRVDGQVLNTSMECGWADSTESASCGTDATVTTTSRFYRLGWLANQSSSQSMALWDSLQYNASGSIIRRHQYNKQIQVFVYPTGSNRMTVDSVPGFANPLVFTYTGAGDRNTEWLRNLDSTLYERAYTYDGLGRSVGVGNFKSFDNRADPTVWSFHQLLKGTGIRYNVQGQMVQTDGAATIAWYDGDNVATAMNGSESWHFLHHGLDSPLMGWYVGNNVVPRMFYFITDGNGRQYAIADTMGNWSGVTYGNTDGTISGWMQAGGVSSGASYAASRQGNGNTPQISYFRNRLYDQRTGQWTQEDPMGVAGGINLYQYNGNNPVAFSDPFGLCRRADGSDDGKPCTITFTVERKGATAHSTTGSYSLSSNVEGAGTLTGATLEPPASADRSGNKYTRIRAGNYSATSDHGHSTHAAIRLADDGGQRNIMVHSGNSPSDTKGCILLGASSSGSDRLAAGTSKPSVDAVRDYIEGVTQWDHGRAPKINVVVVNPPQ